MFQRIFVEEDLIHHPRAQRVLSHFAHLSPQLISKVEEVFGKVKKPYLQKRTSLNLFLGRKKGARG